MNFLDIILIVPLALAAWRGYKKGLIIELFTLLAVLVGIYCAIHFSNYMSEWLQDSFEMQGKYLPVIAFTLTLLAVGAMIFFAGKLIEKGVKMIALGTVNKVLGITFSVAKVLLILSIAIRVLEGYDREQNLVSNEIKSQSLLYNPIKSIAMKTMPELDENNGILDKIKSRSEEILNS